MNDEDALTALLEQVNAGAFNPDLPAEGAPARTHADILAAYRAATAAARSERNLVDAEIARLQARRAQLDSAEHTALDTLIREEEQLRDQALERLKVAVLAALGLSGSEGEALWRAALAGATGGTVFREWAAHQASVLQALRSIAQDPEARQRARTRHYYDHLQIS